MDYSTNNGFIIVSIITVVLFLILFVPLLPGILIAASIRRQVEKILKQNAATIITQYNPPHGLSPAEIGLIYDSVCGEKEIRATLFDLAQRNIITITSEKAVTIIKPEEYKDLKEYEKVAIRMFDKDVAKEDAVNKVRMVVVVQSDDGPKELSLSSPVRQTERVFTRAVQQSLKDRGFSIKDYHREFWIRVFYGVLLLCLAPWIYVVSTGIESNGIYYPPWSIGSILSGFWFALFMGFFLLMPAFVLVSFVAMKLFVKIAGRVWINTKQVRKLWPELEGYRRFLETTDLSRIQFESEHTAHNPVTDTLPYAMIFNLETKWHERLAGMQKQKVKR